MEGTIYIYTVLDWGRRSRWRVLYASKLFYMGGGVEVGGYCLYQICSRLGEEEKVEGAVDIAEAVYFLHNLSTPVVHQHIAGR